jgi:hypothetical protein
MSYPGTPPQSARSTHSRDQTGRADQPSWSFSNRSHDTAAETKPEDPWNRHQGDQSRLCHDIEQQTYLTGASQNYRDGPVSRSSCPCHPSRRLASARGTRRGSRNVSQWVDSLTADNGDTTPQAPTAPLGQPVYLTRSSAEIPETDNSGKNRQYSSDKSASRCACPECAASVQANLPDAEQRIAVKQEELDTAKSDLADARPQGHDTEA